MAGKPFDRGKLDNFRWYHGGIRRLQAESRVSLPGQFLVRDSISTPGEYVLTCFWRRRPMNFKINKSRKEGTDNLVFHFEEEQFGTVQDLINFYISHQKPVTELSGAMLSLAVTSPNFTKGSDADVVDGNGNKENVGGDAGIDPFKDDGPVAYEDSIHQPTMIGGRLSRFAQRSLLKSNLSNNFTSGSLPNIFVPRDLAILTRPLPAIPERSTAGSLTDLSPPPLPPRNPPKPKRAPSLKSKAKDKPTVFVKRQGLLTEVDEDALAQDYCDIDYAEMDYDVSETPVPGMDPENQLGAENRFTVLRDYDVLSPSRSSSALSSRGSTQSSSSRASTQSALTVPGLYNTLSSSASLYDQLSPNSFYDKLSPNNTKVIRRTRSDQDILDRDSACVMESPQLIPDVRLTGPFMHSDGDLDEQDRTLTRKTAAAPPYRLPRKICLDNYTGILLTSPYNKPLQSDLCTHVTKILLRDSPMSLAMHLTFMTSDFLLRQTAPLNAELPKLLREKLAHGLFAAFQSSAVSFREDILERHNTFKAFVTASILNSANEDEAVQLMSRWIDVVEALNGVGNCFDVASILSALCSAEVESAHSIQDQLALLSPAAAQRLRNELRPQLIRIEHGAGQPALLDLPAVQYLVNVLDVGDLGFTLVSDGIGDLDSFWRHLEASRVYLSVASQILENVQFRLDQFESNNWSNGRTISDKQHPEETYDLLRKSTPEQHSDTYDVLRPAENGNMESELSIEVGNFGSPKKSDENTQVSTGSVQGGKRNLDDRPTSLQPEILELFRTEFQMRFLWGSNAAALSAATRYGRLGNILRVLSERWQNS